ncbi:MAG: signal peptidase I [Patescibacteria group bacterium]
MSKKAVWKTIIGLGTLSGILYYCVQSNVRLFFVITGSMEPLIPTRSFIISKKIGVNEVKKEKVIIFNDQNNKRITAHRVVEIQDGRYVTKGDSNTYGDRYLVKSEDILGQVVGIFPIIDSLYLGMHLIFLVLVLALGVLTKRFLLFLKHGISCPTTAYSAFYRLCVFRCTKKTVCSG